jgi:hypothetical protein
MKCTNATKFNRKSGGAEWRDLLFIIRTIESESKHYPPLCHPDRSVAKWRDLQFRGPLMEMVTTEPSDALQALYATIKSLLISTPRPGPCGKLR